MSIPTNTLSPEKQDIRVEPATIEDLPELLQLVAELMNIQDDFLLKPEAHER